MSNRFARHHESWSAFVDYAKTYPAQHDGGRSDRCTDWNGNLTFDEAADMAAVGWTEAAPDADRLARGITRQVIANREDSTWTFPQDVVGEAVDVATFLTGTPECFVTPTRVSTVAPAQVVRIVVSTGALAEVDPGEIRRRGAAIVALIDCITDAGYACEVWSWAAATEYTGRISHAVKLQPSDQPINIARLMFALSHPAAHRRIMFSARCNPEVPSAILRGFGGMGHTVNGDPEPGDLPDDVAENHTIVVTAITKSQSWDFDSSVRWIESTIARLASGK